MKIIYRGILLIIILIGFMVTLMGKFHDFTGQIHSIDRRQEPILFVGGFPRSGTTLMRVLLDTHPKIRCGQETHVIPRLLMHLGYTQKRREKRRLHEAGVTENVLESAVASFMYDIIKNHGKMAPILCNKDPLTLRNTTYLAKLFPNAKFLLVVRDGRAVVNSILSRRIIIRGLKNKTYEQLLVKWNNSVKTMYDQCVWLGPLKCLTVHYEHLVLSPELTMRTVLRFVGVRWNDRVLHHEELVGKPNGPVVSRLEKSSNQVKEPIYYRSLYRWTNNYPIQSRKTVNELAPIMRKLGYNTIDRKPDYRKMILD